MHYSVSKDVPESWEHIIVAFITSVEYDIEFNRGIPIEDVQFSLKRELLNITYSGGSKITDAYAMFAREMSSLTCSDCGVPATRKIFESPKCDNCF